MSCNVVALWKVFLDLIDGPVVGLLLERLLGFGARARISAGRERDEHNPSTPAIKSLRMRPSLRSGSLWSSVPLPMFTLRHASVQSPNPRTTGCPGPPCLPGVHRCAGAASARTVTPSLPRPWPTAERSPRKTTRRRLEHETAHRQWAADVHPPTPVSSPRSSASARRDPLVVEGSESAQDRHPSKRHFGWWVEGRKASGGLFMKTWWPSRGLADLIARWTGGGAGPDSQRDPQPPDH